jgi:hypothetical protein
MMHDIPTITHDALYDLMIVSYNNSKLLVTNDNVKE